MEIYCNNCDRSYYNWLVLVNLRNTLQIGGKTGERLCGRVEGLHRKKKDANGAVEGVISRLQESISNASLDGKQSITNFFSSPNTQKMMDRYAEELEKGKDGAGKIFKDLTEDAVNLFTQNKQKEAEKKAREEILDAYGKGVYLEAALAAAAIIVSAPVIAVNLTGASLGTLAVKLGIENAKLENVFELGGLLGGIQAISDGKKPDEIIAKFAEGGKSQLAWSSALVLGGLGLTIMAEVLPMFVVAGAAQVAFVSLVNSKKK